MKTKLKQSGRFFTRALAQYGVVVLFVAFTVMASMGWIARAAANSVEQGLEPTRAEMRREQIHEERAQLTELAEHEHRLTVIETEQRNQGKQLDDILGYIKSLLVGVFGMLALQASSVLWGKRPKSAGVDD